MSERPVRERRPFRFGAVDGDRWSMPRSPRVVPAGTMSRTSVAALVSVVAVLGACAAAPPPPPPSCPPAVMPPVAASAAPRASATASSPPGAPVPMLAPRDAAAVGFCTADEMRAASDEIGAIAKLVRALPKDASSAAPVTERMVKLYSSKCYARGNLARELDEKEFKAARALSVTTWWDAGGHAFFRDALDHANAIHIAPQVPELLAAELLDAADPLRLVVCPSSGAVCDPLAQGAALDIGRELTRVSLLHASPTRAQSEPDRQATPEACALLVRKDPPADRLPRFAACVDRLVPRRAALPEARYRSPKGWLVLRGRRGHYHFCDEVRAYDLETGSAYIASRCSGLVLASSGAVNQDATRAAGTVETHVGTVSVDALRRLALVLWLKDKVTDDARQYAKFPLPAGIPMPDPETGFGFGYGSGGWAHSGQTSIHFEVVDGTTTVISGSFRWPDAYQTADQVADDLVLSAEATLQEGCPKVALPASLTAARQAGGVSGIDASPDALRKNADDLSAALSGLRKTKVCKK